MVVAPPPQWWLTWPIRQQLWSSLSGSLSHPWTLWCQVNSCCHDISYRVKQALLFLLFLSSSNEVFSCGLSLSAWLCILVFCCNSCQNVYLFTFLYLVHRKVRTCFEGRHCFQVTLLLLDLYVLLLFISVWVVWDTADVSVEGKDHPKMKI